MERILIDISEFSEGGYIYDIRDNEDFENNPDPLDGGLCTSPDIRDAIEMACEQAKELVVRLSNQKQ